MMLEDAAGCHRSHAEEDQRESVLVEINCDRKNIPEHGTPLRMQNDQGPWWQAATPAIRGYRGAGYMQWALKARYDKNTREKVGWNTNLDERPPADQLNLSPARSIPVATIAETWEEFPQLMLMCTFVTTGHFGRKFRVNFEHAWRHGTADAWLDGQPLLGDKGIVPTPLMPEGIEVKVPLPKDEMDEEMDLDLSSDEFEA
eukprot:gene7231-2854_t